MSDPPLTLPAFPDPRGRNWSTLCHAPNLSAISHGWFSGVPGLNIHPILEIIIAMGFNIYFFSCARPIYPNPSAIKDLEK